MIQATAPEPLKFMVGGKALTAAEVADLGQKRTRTAPVTQDSFHKGFRVEGHPPGALEEAKKVCDARYAYFTREREAGRNPGKTPKQWDESYWRNNQKKRPVRAKPYEVPEAAQVCADLAKKAGWLDVAVVELKREKV
jgi:hypothetical protein